MINYADIHIWGEHVATVAWDEQRQTGSFEYAPDFVKKGIQLSPLMMPVEENRLYQFPSLSEETFMGLPGLLADALPDAFGKALLDRWLASVGRDFANPIERLCYQGRRSMGALELSACKGVWYQYDGMSTAGGKRQGSLHDKTF